jgi:hypothetical protein
MLQSAAERQQQLSLGATGTEKTTDPRPPKRNKKLPPLVRWLRAIGLAAVLFGWGGLVREDSFWVGAIAIYLGFAVLVLDIWFEPDFRNSWKTKVTISGIILLVVIAFSWRIVFLDAPLPIAAFSTSGEYPIGTVISGIAWRPQFTELDMDIRDPTDRPYEDLNLVVRPDSAIAAIAQATGLYGVSFEDKNGVTTHLVDFDTRTGNSKAVPLVLVATDAGYKVRCGHLPAQSSLKIVMALTDIKWNPTPPVDFEESFKDPNYMLRFKFDDFSTYWLGYKDADVYAPRPKSSEWLRVDGSYVVSHRRRNISQKFQIGGNIIMPQAQPVTP